MAVTIIERSTLLKLYDEAAAWLEPDEAVAEVAGRTGQDPVTIEGVLASRESAHTALMEGAHG